MEISFGEPFSQESESYMAYKNPLGHSRVLWLSWEIGQRSFRKIKMIEKGNESPQLPPAFKMPYSCHKYMPCTRSGYLMKLQLTRQHHT